MVCHRSSVPLLGVFLLQACSATTTVPLTDGRALATLKNDVGGASKARVSDRTGSASLPIAAVLDAQPAALTVLTPEGQQLQVNWTNADRIVTVDRGRGAAYGAIIGALTLGGGFLAWSLNASDDGIRIGPSPSEMRLGGTVVSALVGAGVGALVGRSMGYRHDWVFAR